jgi:3',5'-cyclic AMP phosphodiesterase CpdA
MAFRVAQISDTHLSPVHPNFVGNFERISADLRRSAPDLVVNTGDLTVDGADRIDDLAMARQLHDAIGLPWRAVPGNHDVGDDPLPTARQPANAERLERYAATVGADSFVLDAPGWRLIGINSLVLGSELPAAAEQLAMLRDAADDAGDRAIALFLHKPLYLGGDDPDGTYWRVRNVGRTKLMEAFGTRRPALVASGHMHQYRRLEYDGMTHLWAPSAAFVVGDGYQQRMGTKLVGYLAHEFRADGSFDSTLVTVDGLALDDIADLPEIYGPQKPIQATHSARPSWSCPELGSIR